MNAFIQNSANSFFVHPPCICPQRYPSWPTHSYQRNVELHKSGAIYNIPTQGVRTLQAGARINAITYNPQGMELV